MDNEVIFTHCGKLGDMLYSLMVGSWLHKAYGRKIHWVLPRDFPPFRYIAKLLEAQEQTSRVSLVPHKITDYSCGGQPYKFDPMVHGIEGEYFNLGFRGYPDKFLPAFYAEEYGLGYDSDFTLAVTGDEGGDKASVKKPYRSAELAMQMFMPDVPPLPTSIDLLELAQLIRYRASEFHCWFCGIAVLCWLARIPANVYRVEGHAPMAYYFPDARNVKFHHLAKHPKLMAVERDSGVKDRIDYIHDLYPADEFRGKWLLIREVGHGEIYVYNINAKTKQHITTDTTLKLLSFDDIPTVEIPAAQFREIKIEAPIKVEK